MELAIDKREDRQADNDDAAKGRPLSSRSESQQTSRPRSSRFQEGVSNIDLDAAIASSEVASETADIASRSLNETRNMSGRTLVAGNGARKTRHLPSRRSTTRISTELPQRSIESSKGSKAQRKSNRLSRLTAATTFVRGVLGKRSSEAGPAKEQQNMSKRRELRQRSAKEPKAEEQTKKKARKETVISKDASDRDQASSETVTRPVPEISLNPRSKKWLTAGLYLGQTRDFDPRLKPGQQNKKRLSKPKALKGPDNAALPLPMFKGEKFIERGRNFKLPFDVFNPLPPGQPKPDEWKKTRKNVFVGDAAVEWRKNPQLPLSRCICSIEDGCDENCQNRYMLYECDDMNCAIGPDHCTNRAFASLKERYKKGDKFNIGVEVMKTQSKGYGVRANRSFEPHQAIVEYAGEIITQEECERRMREEYKNNECYYLMTFHQNMIIDATRGSIARFVNHSCTPNCHMVKWIVGGKPRMALFAGENGILTGEELTYDYNFDPFSQKNVQQCHCGSSNCRGVLGPRPNRDTLKPKTTESMVAGAKRKLGEVLSRGDSNAPSKKRAKSSMDRSSMGSSSSDKENNLHGQKAKKVRSNGKLIKAKSKKVSALHRTKALKVRAKQTFLSKNRANKLRYSAQFEVKVTVPKKPPTTMFPGLLKAAAGRASSRDGKECITVTPMVA